MTLRPYQVEAVEAVMRTLESDGGALLVMATGLGKTVVFSEVARRFLDSTNGSVLVLAHREELVFQAAGSLGYVHDDVGIEMAGLRAASGLIRDRLVVGTVQTVSRRLKRIPNDKYSLVVIDEAHHAAASSYRRVIEHFKSGGAKVLGVTATPRRGDNGRILSLFGSVAYRYDIRNGINDGWLVPVKQMFITDLKVDFSLVRITEGDYSASDLARIMREEKTLHAVSEVALESKSRGSVIVYTPDVSTAHLAADVINRYSPGCAVAIDGEMDRTLRRGAVAAFRDGSVPILVNCMIATEGFDAPNASTIVMARPTRSVALYAQILGRGTRVLPGVVDGIETSEERKRRIAASNKREMVIWDVVPTNSSLKLATAYDVIADEDAAEVVRMIKERRYASREKQDDIEDVLHEIEIAKEVQLARISSERRRLVAKVDYRVKSRDPFGLDWSDGDGYDSTPPTEQQMEVLRRLGVDAKSLPRTRRGASDMIDILVGRRKAGLATYRQVRQLVNRGVPREVAMRMLFSEASYLIERLVRNQWKFFGVRIPKTVEELASWRIGRARIDRSAAGSAACSQGQ